MLEIINDFASEIKNAVVHAKLEKSFAVAKFNRPLVDNDNPDMLMQEKIPLEFFNFWVDNKLLVILDSQRTMKNDNEYEYQVFFI